MTVVPTRSPHTKHATVLWAAVVLVLATLATGFPAATVAATAKTGTPRSILGVPVPASARVKGTATTPTTPAPAPAATTPAATAPATTTPATATPASGSQPGTVAPATTTPASATTPTAANPVFRSTAGSTVAAAHKTKSTRLSTGALALVVFGALLVLGCLLWGLTRWLALEPRWTASLMHSLREASYRASATWAEFSDWLRLGH